MLNKLTSIPKNPTVQKLTLLAAGAAAAYYGGPAARDAVYQYLPQIAQALGLL